MTKRFHDGPWVSHQDHAALVEATRVLVKAAERERDEARETIMGLEEQNKALRGDEPPATCSTSPCGKWFRIEYGGLATPWFKDVEHAWEHVAAREKGGGR